MAMQAAVLDGQRWQLKKLGSGLPVSFGQIVRIISTLQDPGIDVHEPSRGSLGLGQQLTLSKVTL